MLANAIVFAVTAIQAIQPSARVPSILLSVASSYRPMEFVMMLADAGVPAGIEIYARDNGQPRMMSFDYSRDLNVPIEAIIAAFNANHSDYRAVMTNGVVMIRPTATVTGSYLDSPASFGRVMVTGVTRAGLMTFAPLQGRTPAAALNDGIEGSGHSTFEDRGDGANLELDGTGRTVLAVLNQIVAQSPHQAWFVITSDERDRPTIVQFGFRGAKGMGTGISAEK